MKREFETKMRQQESHTSDSLDDTDLEVREMVQEQHHRMEAHELETLRSDMFDRDRDDTSRERLMCIGVWPGQGVARPERRLRSSPPSRMGRASRCMDMQGEYMCMTRVSHRSRMHSHSQSLLESGMYNRATKTVVEKLIWPQKNLQYGFLQKGIMFKQLTYHHLITGEVSTLAQCRSVPEVQGHLRLLRGFLTGCSGGPLGPGACILCSGLEECRGS